MVMIAQIMDMVRTMKTAMAIITTLRVMATTTKIMVMEISTAMKASHMDMKAIHTAMKASHMVTKAIHTAMKASLMVTKVNLMDMKRSLMVMKVKHMVMKASLTVTEKSIIPRNNIINISYKIQFLKKFHLKFFFNIPLVENFNYIRLLTIKRFMKDITCEYSIMHKHMQTN